MRNKKLILDLEKVGLKDVALVGGKNASLGEMLQKLTPKGVAIPSGFVVTAEAYRYFLRETKLDSFIKESLKGLNTHNVRDLAVVGKKIREAIVNAEFPKELELEIEKAYKGLEKKYGKNIDVAVRSSATAEDLPGASFAGEHETYLGIRGVEDVTRATRSAMASLFTNRAISYRVDKGFGHTKVALSVAVQLMVRSDSGASGVMFTLDTESGFKDLVLINAAWGLGEMVVQGKVNPDEYLVAKKNLGSVPNPVISKSLGSKDRKMIYAKGKKGIRPVKVVPTSPKERNSFVLSEKEILTLARWGVEIEKHYSKKYDKWTPMDMEWAKDGRTGKLFIVQARPETIHAGRDFTKVHEYIRLEDGKLLTQGVSVGSKIAVGKARVILDAKDIHKFKAGEVLVTDMTDPDWEPIMKIASAIITDKGGRTSHAAIVSRELGIPAVVGSGNATRKIKTGQDVTIDTVGSDGLVFQGLLKFKVRERDLKTIPETKTKIMMNIGTPETAFEKSLLPNKGVGLAREEFIIASEIGIHPMALINYKKLSTPLKKKIDAKSLGWEDKKQFYVDKLAYGIAKIGTAFNPHPVIVRFSDFKTNEYRTLLGGELYEPIEQNPMIGWRGASRYYHENFKEAFKLELLALKKVRNEMGLKNVIPMVPFCRTPKEGIAILKLMKEAGLKPKYFNKDKDTLPNRQTDMPVYVMCEIPSNVINAEEFLDIFDGMSIGSNDLTQLILGLDRDSEIVSGVGNEKDPALKSAVADIIKKCKKRGKYIGICGQAPSDYPDFAAFLVSEGIESMSLTPDTVVETTIAVAKQEKKK
ncbi:MAG: phosphoenolpyruvate synthase [Candidatus Colwellbacteria bacterium CG10_big_fil_rev_8_21_14_0_10_42_22]|uniref:Phosphoenolpyruvate synthase n=1 Tax=Candidatus Colwellbacteria bacterium CG10_big_fil_rev_8_21_14_0_10_42_22 TaxID=1974540 RepID=A0A2H0VFM1_9BACT|nr:MAG: phosphoenolpyruvate synthase [Candidatus Colwellbacteria bacterium CG10_big_fil_rev_8_21_14_0_10_42_22]